ncbi:MULTISPECIES: zinc ribbon domain-containing protein [Deinococcus]|uniref:Zinc ribbon domain-containing protein n=1 Tax=Deinococcus rufus TaxID=2136097 RepID=A0ABV7Z8K2_9DEIO|nr:zinc ribbon domain-containing protein [Deinococcus sp. AB2017081]WQE94669.1 zinc ribbon domain-containing protein [Deinococcus sp. AB2017081]
MRGDRILVDLSTRAYPTPMQAARLDTWLDATSSISAALTALPVALRADAVAGLPDAWPEVPISILRQIVRWADRGTTIRRDCVPLDDEVMAVTPYLVHVVGLDDLLLSDVTRLPLGLSGALLADGARRLDEVDASLQTQLRSGRAGPVGAADVQQMVRRYGTLLGTTYRTAGVPGAERARYATLRAYRAPDGGRQWSITWSIRIAPRWLPAASVDDCVGVDVGVRRLLTWASRDHAGSVTGWRLTAGEWQEDSTMEAAVRRRALFARSAAELDAALRGILAFRRVAIEATNWRGLAGTPQIDAMTASAVVDVRHWLTALARVTGSAVVPVSAWSSSRHCGHCGQPGVRQGSHFTCAICGDADADDNAARYLRACA